MSIKNIINLINSNKNYNLVMRQVKNDWTHDAASKQYFKIINENNDIKVKGIMNQKDFDELYFALKENANYEYFHIENEEIDNKYIFQNKQAKTKIINI